MCARCWDADVLDQPDLLAFSQQVRPERDDAIAVLDLAVDIGALVIHTRDLHRPPVDVRRCATDYPYARALAGIEQGTDWYFQRAGGARVREFDGHGGAQGGGRQLRAQDVAS